MEHEEAVGWLPTLMAQALFRRTRARNYFLPRVAERRNAASTLAQFGYLLTGDLLDLDRRRSVFRMDVDEFNSPISDRTESPADLGKAVLIKASCASP